MKKNFLKKLASVLSLALVVSTITPAASASAAAAPNLAKRYTNVYEGNGYAYTVKNAKGYTVKWTVSGKGAEYVNLSKKTGASTKLTVDTEGEVAAKNKNVTVKANFYKGGKLVKAAGDVVKVKVSAKDVAIVTAEANVDLTAVAAGEVVDFNRALTPKNATSLTTWSVTDKAGNATTDATIDGTGNFKADKVGEYTITASTSNVKGGKVFATATQDVKVVLAIKDVKQTAINKLEVTFGADASKIVTNKNLSVELKGTNANSYVKEVAFSADGKTATVTVYNNFVDKKEYTVTYDKKSVGFIASVGEVASVVIKDQVVKYSEPTALDIKLFDANGIDVTTETEFDKVRAEITNNVGWVDYQPDGDGKIKATLYNIGDVATIKATYRTGKFDTAGKSIDVVSNVATITAVKEVITEGTLVDYTAVVTNINKKLDWSKTVKKIAKEDRGYLEAKTVVNGENIDSHIESGFTFKSSNSNILLVDEYGNFNAVNEGTAYVTAEYKNYTVVFPVEVGAKRAAATISLDKPSITLSAKVADSVTVKVTVKDQYGDDRLKENVTVDVLSEPTTAGTKVGYADGVGEATFTSGVGTLTGTYTYKLTSEKLTVRVDVRVSKDGDSTIASYRVEQDDIKFDLKVDGSEDSKLVNNIKVVPYNANGVKVAPSGVTPNITITDPDGDKTPATVVGAWSTTQQLYDYTASRINKFDTNGDATETGTYTIEVSVDGVKKATTSFKVEDTQELPAVTLKRIDTNSKLSVVSGDSIATALVSAGAIKASLGWKNFGVDDADELTFVGVEVASVNNSDVRIDKFGNIVFVRAGIDKDVVVYIKSYTFETVLDGNGRIVTLEVPNSTHNVVLNVK